VSCRKKGRNTVGSTWLLRSSLQVQLLQELDGMRLAKVIQVLEFVVPAANNDELTFRLEVVETRSRRDRRYRIRLYRLETFRTKVLLGASRVRRWVTADYRCWVIDDNLLDDGVRFPTPRAAEKHFLNRLEDQLGLRVPRIRRGVTR